MTEHIALDIICVLAMFILAYMIKLNDLFNSKARRALLEVVFVVTTAIIAEIITLTFLAPNWIERALNMTFCVIGFGISPFAPLLMARTFLGPEAKEKVVSYLPALANLLLSALSPFYGFIFYISPANEYFRGSWFLFYVLAYLFGIALFLVRTLGSLHSYQNKNKAVLLGLVLLTLVGTTMQILWPEILSTWPTVTLVIILGYAYYSELLEKHDVTTGLFNRRAYEEHLPAYTSKKGGTIVLFDIDDFKQVNDLYGHLYGDQCLKRVAASIRACFAEIGPSYRIGGDEFSVLSECRDKKSIRQAETAFLEEMARARSQDPKIPSVSLGYAFWDPSLKITETIEAADRQLFLSKKRGKAGRPKVIS